jgi:hypothetical protein
VLKLDAKTIVALTGLVAVLSGGAELRMAVNRLEDKLARVDERVRTIEIEVSPRASARLER